MVLFIPAAITGSGNVVGGKIVLIRNFAKDIEEAFIGGIEFYSGIGISSTRYD